MNSLDASQAYMKKDNSFIPWHQINSFTQESKDGRTSLNQEREMQRNEDDADRTSSNTEKKMMQIIQALTGDISEQKREIRMGVLATK
ncbi:hypothetical protein SAY86_022753 [Trapa natans]|uniref:Uncharacterized protein n=1 Tax=Trapa natans TaxID=22666 RepID=A0AAN7RAX9_TRANT|nr:hypothetical protein SAY86_022753 [Trapa natans]